MQRKISRIFIANRGEIAVRIIKTCHRLGIETCVGYSSADRKALFVKLAGHAVELGPAPAGESYLNGARIVEAARFLQCDAIHPGYGFLSENADFAALVAASGLIFIGPSPETIARMGDKIAARKEMEAIGVPVVPGFHGAAHDDAFLAREAGKIGYPILIKAARGGGGRGMRLVEREADFLEALDSARREAGNAFGDSSVFLEKYILEPRHIEVQVFGDLHGHVLHFFERDCSIQRRHQKIIEESPAPGLPAAVREQVLAHALLAVRSLGYQNAGTVEFVYSPAEQTCYFLEINTRLQVEHPVTEMVTGMDLVELQIRVAEGLSLGDLNPGSQGHAVELRLYAEDPEQGFLPQSGPVHLFSLPEAEGLRVDTGIESGSEISVYYDSMVAKIIGYGENRDLALDRLSEALKRLSLLGIRHNASFLAAIIDHPDFRAAKIDTGFLARHFEGGFRQTTDPELQAVAVAAAGLLHRSNARYLEENSQRQKEQNRTAWHMYPSFELWKA